MKVAAGCRRSDKVTTIFLLLLAFSNTAPAAASFTLTESSGVGMCTNPGYVLEAFQYSSSATYNCDGLGGATWASATIGYRHRGDTTAPAGPCTPCDCGSVCAPCTFSGLTPSRGVEYEIVMRVCDQATGLTCVDYVDGPYTGTYLDFTFTPSPASVPTTGTLDAVACVTSDCYGGPAAGITFDRVLAHGSMTAVTSDGGPSTTDAAGCAHTNYPGDFGPLPADFYSLTYHFGPLHYNPGGFLLTTGTTVVNPVVTLTLSFGPYQVNQAITVFATATDSLGNLSSVTLTLPSGAVPYSLLPCPTDISSYITAPTQSFTPLVAGTYTFTAEATNCVGGTGWDQVTIVVGGCDLTAVVNPVSPETGSDFSVTANLGAGCPAGTRNMEFTIVDPMGATHKATAETVGGGAGPVSYLTQFDNSPNTEICGLYKLTIKNPVTEDYKYPISVTIPIEECKIVTSKGAKTFGEPMASQIANCQNVQDPFSRDVVTCCPFNCCGTVSFNKDCGYPTVSYPGGIAPADMERRTGVAQANRQRTGMEELCSAPDPSSSGTYIVVDLNASRYRIIGTSLAEDNNARTFYLVDTRDGPQRNGCFVGTSDIEACGTRLENFVVDKVVYKNHIETYVVPYIPIPDMRICLGFYMTWMPPYEYVLEYSRYAYVYGRDYTNEFYCYADEPNAGASTADTIRKSYWCHNTNLGWYSVLGTNRGNKMNMAITNESIQHVRRWNNLTGYVVLGHVCPWCMTCYDVQLVG